MSKLKRFKDQSGSPHAFMSGASQAACGPHADGRRRGAGGWHMGGALALATAVAASLLVTTPTTSATAAPGDGTFASAFADPAAEYLPSNRYWTAGGTGDPQQVRADIKAQSENGIGRVTFNDLVLAQYYGADRAFGSPAWTAKLTEAVRAGLEYDVQVDALIAPGWSAGSNRVTPDTAGSAKTLGSGRSAVLVPGETFSGQIPLSELAAGVTQRDLAAVLAVRCADACAGSPVQLDADSVVDLTDAVDRSGADAAGTGLTVEWTAPAGPADGSWLVLSYFSQGSGLKPTAGMDANIRGTVLVDHYGAAGAQALMDTWNEDVLTDELKGLLAENAGSMWLDSLELTEASNWTPSLLSDFEARRGYSLREGLPAISLEDPEFTFTDGSGERYLADWKQTMSENFIQNHLTPLREWSHELGMTLRYQTYSSHGAIAMSPSDAWQAVDVPESESEDSRAVAAAAALQGAAVVPTECCAFIDFGNSSWRQQWSDVLFRVNQTLSTGSTLVEFHGFPEQNVTDLMFIMGPNEWPGWSPFIPVTGIAEPWDTRQPSWEQQKSINEYLGRSQLVLRQGTLATDFAVYADDIDAMGEGPLASQALAGAGYSWGYLSDQDLQAQTVTGGVLAADGPGYRALVIQEQPTLSVASAQRILDYAATGFPVVFAGELPTRAVHTPDATNQDVALAAVIADIQALENVRTVATVDELGGALGGVNVAPAAAVADPSSLQIIRRTSAAGDFYFAFNASEQAVSTRVQLTGAGNAYELDPWTGTTGIVPGVAAGESSVTVPVQLAPGETAVFAVTSDPASLGFASPPADPIVTASAPLVSQGGSVVARVTEAGDVTAETAAGVALEASVAEVPAAPELAPWTVQIESWQRPASGLITDKVALDDLAVPAHEDGTLPTWAELGLPDTSGIGTYRSTFTLPSEWREGAGLMLSTGPNPHSYALRVNGAAVPVSQVDTRTDIGAFLQPGENTLEVVVATTLRNAVVSQSPSQAGGSGLDRQTYGLAGPVTLAAYVDVLPVAPTDGGEGEGPGEGPGEEPEVPVVPTDPGTDPPVAPGDTHEAGGPLATTGGTSLLGALLLALLLLGGGTAVLVRRRNARLSE